MIITRKNDIIGQANTSDQLFLFIKDYINDLRAPSDQFRNASQEILTIDKIGITRLIRYLKSNCFNVKSKLQIGYWLVRGHSKEYAIEIISRHQKEASPSSLKHWVKKGYAYETAVEIRSQEQKKRSSYLSDKLKQDDFRKVFSNHNCEFWIKRGYSLEEAQKKVEEQNQWVNSEESYIQRYGEDEGKIRWAAFKNNSGFSLDLFLKKYGEQEGRKRFENLCSRIGCSYQKYIQRYGLQIGAEKWNQYLQHSKGKGSLGWYISKYGKTEGTIRYEEKCKTIAYSHTLSHLKKKYGDEEGEQRYIEWMEKLKVKQGTASKDSLSVFIPFYKFLRKIGFASTDIYWGIQGRSEWFLNDSDNFYLYDFTIKPNKIIVEFNGEHVHPNPIWKISDRSRWEQWKHPWTGECAELRLDFDIKKNNFAIDHGFEVYTIWSEDGSQYNIEKLKGIL